MIDADFYDDWIEILRGRLSEMGYTIPVSSSHEDISVLYFNAIRRRIQPAPRTIHRSAEFSCPHDLQVGLNELEAKITGGTDLTPYLSRGLKNASRHDDLLNDWGVYHLHLGTNVEGDGFAERTGPVLFALVTSSSLYEIQIYPHGNWSNREVVEIIHKNWPDTIERYRLKGIVDVAYNPTSENIRQLRDAHVNSILKMDDGTIYAPIGGGMMSNGTGSDVLLQADRHARMIVDIERSIKSDPGEILEALKERGHDGASPLRLVFQSDQNGLWVHCEEFSIRFRIQNAIP